MRIRAEQWAALSGLVLESVIDDGVSFVHRLARKFDLDVGDVPIRTYVGNGLQKLLQGAAVALLDFVDMVQSLLSRVVGRVLSVLDNPLALSLISQVVRWVARACDWLKLAELALQVRNFLLPLVVRILFKVFGPPQYRYARLRQRLEEVDDLVVVPWRLRRALVESCKGPGFPPILFDAHMHIQSSNCTPLPAVWYVLSQANPIANTLKPRPRRRLANGLGSLVTGVFGDIARLPTHQLGRLVVSLNDGLQDLLPGGGGSYVGISIVLTMDLDYCHIDGYLGIPIYKTNNGEMTFLYRYVRGSKAELGERIAIKEYSSTSRAVQREQSGISIEEKDETYPVGSDLYESWNQQQWRTKRAVVEHPWRLLPMYHYDPRRYVQSDKYKKDELWDAPFKKVATRSQDGLFIGFKMYTPLGYRPLETAKAVKAIQTKFYQKCVEEDIPIVNHCGPGGFFSPEREIYPYLNDRTLLAKMVADKGGEAYPLELWPQEYDSETDREEAKRTLHQGYVRNGGIDRDARLRYFKTEFIHPAAWEKVLREHKTLRLILAHFGTNDHLWTDDLSLLDKEKNLTPLTPNELLALEQRLSDIEAYEEATEAPYPCTKKPKSMSRKIARRMYHIDEWFYLRKKYPEYADKSRPSFDNDGTLMGESWIVNIVNLCTAPGNVYTDLSYLPLHYEMHKHEVCEKHGQERLVCRRFYVWEALATVLHERCEMYRKIMFGTDWFFVVRNTKSYREWFVKAIKGLVRVVARLASLKAKVDRSDKGARKDALKAENKACKCVSTWKKALALFHRFAIVNPIRAYRLLDGDSDHSTVAAHFDTALRVAIASSTGVDKDALEEQRRERYKTFMRARQCLEAMEARVGAGEPLWFSPTDARTPQDPNPSCDISTLWEQAMLC